MSFFMPLSLKINTCETYILMKRISIFLLFIACIFTSNADSPVCLYDKWKNKPSKELMNMGTKFDCSQSADSALVCYSIVTDRMRDSSSSDEDKKMLARSLNNMGFIYGAYFFDYKRAIELFEESSDVAEECGYTKHLPYIYLNIGGTYLACNMMYDSKQLFTDEIWNYLTKALSEGIATKQYDVALVAFLNMGQIHTGNPDPEKISSALRVLATAKFPATVKLTPFVRKYAQGIEEFNSKNYDNAAETFRQMNSLIPADDVNRLRLELIMLQSVVDALTQSGRYNEAIATASQLLEKAKACGAVDNEIMTYRTLSELYKKNRQSDKATEFLLQYHQMKDSTLSARDMTMISKLPIVDELKEIKLQLDKERANRRLILIICVVALTFIILLTGYMVTIIRSRRRLQQYVKELYRKNVELIKAEQREREMREENMRIDAEKYSASSLTTSESRKIADKIIQVMENTELITNPDFSLLQLADTIGYSYKQVSQVVNETLGKNFRTLLNEYRIKEACTRLLDTEGFGQYTIEHIAESVGFNSRSNFSVIFKKITGITPAQFQKNALSDS